MAKSDLLQYLKSHVGERIFVNADDQKPFLLQSVEKDYIRLSQIESLQNITTESFVIPFSAIVSVQEVEGVNGIIIYLVK